MVVLSFPAGGRVTAHLGGGEAGAGSGNRQPWRQVGGRGARR